MAAKYCVLSGPVDPRPIPEETVGKYLVDRLEKGGDTVVQIDASTGAEKTCSQLRDEALAISGGLQELGVMPGDVVMVACGNHPDFSAILLGALHAGASLAPVNPQLDRGDMSHVLSLLEPRCVFCESSCETLPPLADGVTLLTLDSPQFNALLHFTPAATHRESQVAIIMCSSGTTGLPKAVMLTQQNVHAQLLQYRVPQWDVLSGIRPLLVMGSYWLTGLVVLLITLDARCTAVLQQHFSPKLLAENIEKYKIATMLLGSTQLVQLALSDAMEGYDLSSLLPLVTFAGAPVSIELRERAERRLGVSVHMAFGMTELMNSLAPISASVPRNLASCGVLAPNTQAKIIDLDNGKPLGPDQEGELCFRGPTVMLGYYRDPEATAAIIDSDGWLHTADVAYYNKDGLFFVTGRIKSLIKYRGQHVPPAEIEGALLSHPAVQDAAVVGVNNDLDQMHAVGCVVLRPDANARPEELVQHVAGLLPPMKQLHGGVRIMDKIPRTPTGKVRIRELQMQVEK